MTRLQWEVIGDKSVAKVEGLGTIEIYRDKGGMCVDINGKRAWSAWRGDIRSIQLDIHRYISDWEYLNSFR